MRTNTAHPHLLNITLYVLLLFTIIFMVTNMAYPIQSDTQTFSVPELRQRTVSRMTGLEASNWDFTTKPINFVCTDDGAGFLKGHFYVTGNDGVVYDVFRNHTHASAAEGGTLYDIINSNAYYLINWDKSAGVSPTDFNMMTASTGGTLTTEAASNQMYAKFLTGAVADDYVNGLVGGGRLSFGSPITLQIKYAASHNTGSLIKFGIASTTVENAAGTAAQMGFEHCSAASVNIGVYSADGAVRTTDYLLDVVQSTPFGLRLDYLPSSKITAKAANGLTVTHTSNLPSISAASNSDNVFRVGVKSTNTTPKTLKLYSARFIGTSYDSVVGLNAWI